VNRFVKIHHKPLRLGEKIHAAKGQQHDNTERKRAQRKGSNDSGTDLGFHVIMRRSKIRLKGQPEATMPQNVTRRERQGSV
jgi:hypothetical protein